MFELLVTLCLADICADRIVPSPHPMDEATCQSIQTDRLSGWLKDRPAYTASAPRCVPLNELPAANVREFAPGAFVHTGLVEDVSPENAGDVANTGFIVGEDAVAVIDTGTTRVVGQALYVAIRKQTDKPIAFAKCVKTP